MKVAKKKGKSIEARRLADTVNEALALLRESSYVQNPTEVRVESPSSLLDQCIELCGHHESAQQEPIRTVHHFACSGGTLLSKCIAAMPNTQLLSEVDPLSTLYDVPGRPHFSPTDMIMRAKESTKGVSRDLLVALFNDSLSAIYSEVIGCGQRLVIRDHSHSHYCVGPEIPARPSLRSLIAEQFEVISLVSVRNPIDSFLSLDANNWRHFTPYEFSEYCRRYIEFLKEYSDVPLVRYEDFVSDPGTEMQDVCDKLNLPFNEQFLRLFDVFVLTGDSGRRGSKVEQRPRRDVDEDVIKQYEGSSNYSILREMLGY